MKLRERWEGSLPGLILSDDLTVRQVIEGWWDVLVCRLRGHDWEPQYYDYPEARYLEAHFCKRCWKVAQS